MKNFVKNILPLLLLFFFAAPELFSAGTPAGTVIQSRSRVTFSTRSGANADTVYSALLTITVAQKGSFNITPASSALSTQSDSTFAQYAVTATNSGNGNDVGRFSSISSKGWNTALYFDSNGDGVLQAGEISAGTISQTASLAADAQYKMIVRVQVPRGESLNGVKDTTLVTVKSNFDSTKTNFGRYITTVQTTGIDPLNPGVTVNNPSPTVGQNVTFTFIFTNSGSVNANNVVVNNLLPSSLSFISAGTSVGTVNSSSNPVLWTIGTFAPGQTVTVTLTVQVNSGISPGTVIGSLFGINYSVAGNNYSTISNTAQITVSGTLEYGVGLSATFSSLTKEPSDTGWYRFKVRNVGSFKDVPELNVSSSRNIQWKLYRDGNNNSVWDNADPLLTNTNNSQGVDVDSVAIGDSVRVFAQSVIPRLYATNVNDSLRLIVTSAGDGAKKDTVLVVTKVNEPFVEISKSVFPVGSQPAGGVVTYTISYSNAGGSAVTNFSIIDETPSSTDYVANSIKVNGLAVADNHPSVSLQKNENNHTVITVSIGALAVNGNGSVEFKVKIQ